MNDNNEIKLIAIEQNGGQVKGTFSVPLPASRELPSGTLTPNGFMHSGASVLSKFEPMGDRRYNSNDRPIYDTKGIPSSFAEQARLARKYYHEEPITGTVIDVLAQFSVSDVEHIVDDEEIRDFFDTLYHDTSNLSEIVKCASLEYYITCNVFPVRSNKGPKVKARNGKKVPQYQWTILNPENVEITGTLLFDQYLITVKPNQDLINIAKSSDPRVAGLLSTIPPEMLDAIKKGKNIPIDPDKVYHISRNKQPFQRTAVPFIMRNVGPLRVKQKLTEIDLSTADGAINQLVVATIGNDMYPATKEQLLEFAELMRTPSKAYALTWNHTAKIEIKSPDADLFSPEKYEQVNRDILAGYGIARSVVSDGGTYASQSVSIQSLIQWLEWGREDIRRWLEREYKLIAQENGLKTYPRVRFKKVSLSEEKFIKNVLMSLYDRGIISAETLSRETGHDIDVEILRQEQELELKKKGLLMPQSPWQQSKNQDNPIGNAPQNSPGRPDDTPEDGDRDNRDDSPAPHGASLRAKANLESKQDELKTKFKNVYQELENRLSVRLPSVKERDIQDDIIDAAIIAFLVDINELTKQYMVSSFGETYQGITNTDYASDINARALLEDCLSWNRQYVQKFADDLSQGVRDGLSGEQSISDVIQKVFDSNEYRTELFGEEVVNKASFYGEVAGMEKLGYTHGRWNATFENTCEDCVDRHGRIFSKQEILGMYPAHPRCKCFVDWIK